MERRNLRFSVLADIKSDLLNLLSKGYTKTGEWDLDQIANHLADWMTFPMDGFPKMPLLIKILIGIMRITQGKSLYKKFVDNQRMSTGQPKASFQFSVFSFQFSVFQLSTLNYCGAGKSRDLNLKYPIV